MTWLDPAPTIVSWHVFRRLPVRRAGAERALGEAIRAGTFAEAIGSRLVVDDVVHARPGDARGLVGQLRVGRLRTARVELEVEPWSPHESALGLRPARRPPRVQPDRYFTAALALLAAIEECVLAHLAIDPEMVEMRRAS
jgi:hypothetical protein